MPPSPLNISWVLLLALLLAPCSSENLRGVGQLLAGTRHNPSELGEGGLKDGGQTLPGTHHNPSELGEGGLGDGGPTLVVRTQMARELGGHEALDVDGPWDAERKVQGSQGVRKLIEKATLQGPLKNEDFVIVLPCAVGRRLLLAHATRAWRQGIRTLVAINGSDEMAKRLTKEYSNEHNEFYVAAPDDGEGYWAYGPVLAHRYFKGDYKWMLHGDDDTIFFLHAVKTLLKDYDHQTIHAISAPQSPKHLSPFPDRTFFATCVPCFFNPDNPPTGDLRGVGPPLTKPLDPSGQGSDSVVSTGIWRAGVAHTNPSYAYAEANTTQHNTTSDNTAHPTLTGTRAKGSDGIVSGCIVKFGVAYTNPGYVYAYNDSLYQVFQSDWPDQNSHLTTPLAKLVSDKCDYRCKWRIRNQAAAVIMSIAVQNSAAFTFLEAMTDFTSDESIHKDVNILSWDKRKRALHEATIPQKGRQQ
eukprot:gene3746-13806_t